MSVSSLRMYRSGHMERVGFKTRSWAVYIEERFIGYALTTEQAKTYIAEAEQGLR